MMSERYFPTQADKDAGIEEWTVVTIAEIPQWQFLGLHGGSRREIFHQET